MKIFVKLQTVVLLTLMLAGLAIAQTSAGSKTLVSIPVTVIDKKGSRIGGLKKVQFTLLRDNEVSEIDFFAPDTEPVDLLLLIDTSPSTAEATVEIKRAALKLIGTLREGDQMQIVTFDNEVRLRSPLTSNRILLEQAIRASDAGLDEGSVMRDALSKMLRGEFGQNTGRKAVLLLTDGIDVGSSISKDELFFDIEESDAVIYTVYFETKFGNFGRSRGAASTPVSPFPSNQQRVTTVSGNTPTSGNARKYLEQLSEVTGGFYSTVDLTSLSKQLETITSEIRSQYRLGFYLNEIAKPGDSQKLRVTVNIKNTQVRYRNSYRVR